MGRSTAEDKYQAKQQRRRGLQKTRFYCQVCERQCLDENGFKCHVQSDVHMRNLQSQLESHGGSSRSIVNEYSDKFVKDFVSLLKRSHGVKMIGANRFYQEYIKNKDHIHLNSTKWRLLTNALLYMRDEKLLKVVDSNGVNDEQFHIGFIDNSPEAIRRRKREDMMMNPQYDGGVDDTAVSIDSSLQDQIKRAEELKAKMKKTITRDSGAPSDINLNAEGTQPNKKVKVSFGLKGNKLNKNKGLKPNKVIGLNPK